MLMKIAINNVKMKGAYKLKKVLVVGAGFLQSFVIKKAKELGYYVYAIDMDANAVGFKYADEYELINIVDKEAALLYAKEKCVDGVLTAATDYGVLTVSYIAEKMNLPGINFNSAQLIKNKYEVRKRLHEAGADDTGLSYQIAGEADIESITEKVVFPVMVKPCDGSGSRGAARVDSLAQFADACRTAMSCSITKKATVEPFIDGVEYGVESFVCNGKTHILAVMKKWMTKPPYYAELGHAVPSGLSLEIENKIRGCVEKAIEVLGINFGSVNMDLLLTEKGSVHIVDIGARMGGNLIGSHIIPMGTGVDYIGNIVRASVGDEVSFEPKTDKKCVATRLLALTPGKIKALPDMASYINENTFIEHHLEVGNTINEYHTNLDGCGYVVCTADDMTVASECAEKLKNKIDSEIVREN